MRLTAARLVVLLGRAGVNRLLASTPMCLMGAPTPGELDGLTVGVVALWADLFGERNVPQRRDAISKVMLRRCAPAPVITNRRRSRRAVKRQRGDGWGGALLRGVLIGGKNRVVGLVDGDWMWAYKGLGTAKRTVVALPGLGRLGCELAGLTTA